MALGSVRHVVVDKIMSPMGWIFVVGFAVFNVAAFIAIATFMEDIEWTSNGSELSGPSSAIGSRFVEPIEPSTDPISKIEAQIEILADILVALKNDQNGLTVETAARLHRLDALLASLSDELVSVKEGSSGVVSKKGEK